MSKKKICSRIASFVMAGAIAVSQAGFFDAVGGISSLVPAVTVSAADADRNFEIYPVTGESSYTSPVYGDATITLADAKLTVVGEGTPGTHTADRELGAYVGFKIHAPADIAAKYAAAAHDAVVTGIPVSIDTGDGYKSLGTFDMADDWKKTGDDYWFAFWRKITPDTIEKAIASDNQYIEWSYKFDWAEDGDKTADQVVTIKLKADGVTIKKGACTCASENKVVSPYWSNPTFAKSEYAEDYIDTAATCTADMKVKKRCVVCGTADSAAEDVASTALGHSFAVGGGACLRDCGTSITGAPIKGTAAAAPDDGNLGSANGSFNEAKDLMTFSSANLKFAAAENGRAVAGYWIRTVLTATTADIDTSNNTVKYIDTNDSGATATNAFVDAGGTSSTVMLKYITAEMVDNALIAKAKKISDGKIRWTYVINWDSDGDANQSTQTITCEIDASDITLSNPNDVVCTHDPAPLGEANYKLLISKYLKNEENCTVNRTYHKRCKICGAEKTDAEFVEITNSKLGHLYSAEGKCLRTGCAGENTQVGVKLTAHPAVITGEDTFECKQVEGSVDSTEKTDFIINAGKFNWVKATDGGQDRGADGYWVGVKFSVPKDKVDSQLASKIKVGLGKYSTCTATPFTLVDDNCEYIQWFLISPAQIVAAKAKAETGQPAYINYTVKFNLNDGADPEQVVRVRINVNSNDMSFGDNPMGKAYVLNANGSDKDSGTEGTAKTVVNYSTSNDLVYFPTTDANGVNRGKPGYWAGVKVEVPNYADTSSTALLKCYGYTYAESVDAIANDAVWKINGQTTYAVETKTYAQAVSNNAVSLWSNLTKSMETTAAGISAATKIIYKYEINWNSNFGKPQVVYVVIPNNVGLETPVDCDHSDNGIYTGEWDITPASCVTAGSKTNTCAICGDPVTIAIPATNLHTYVETVEKEATCREAGRAKYTCSVCGNSYSQNTPKARHVYTAESDKIAKEATCSENAQYYYACTWCGTYSDVETYEKPDTKTPHEFEYSAKDDKSGKCKACGSFEDGFGRYVKHSVSLKDEIGVNIYMEVEPDLVKSDKLKMIYTVGDSTAQRTATFNPANVDSDGSYKFYCAVSAKEMNDTITYWLTDGTKTGIKREDKVSDYANAALDAYKDNKKAVETVEAMLNFGAYSQLYFKNNTGDLANDGLQNGAVNQEIQAVTAADAAEKLAKAPEEYDGQKADFVELSTASLILKDKNILRLYFTKKTDENLTFVCNGKTLQQYKYNNYIYVQVEGIAAKNLADEQIVTVKCGRAEKDFYYNPMTYCYKVLNSPVSATVTQSLKDLIKSLIIYNEKAKAYLG